MQIDLHIRQPEYGAGTTYMWDKTKYGIRGIGIAKFRLIKHEKLTIKIREEVYKIEKDKILQFLREYPHSRCQIKGVDLIVIPINIMTWLRSERVPEVDKIQEKPETPAEIKLDERQQVLF
jgi:hypothetical protein